MQNSLRFTPFWASLLLLALTACQSPEDAEKQQYESQKNAFLQSIHKIENAGRSLQTAAPRSRQVDDALAQLDEALSQAYQVENDFLDQFDPRLGKAFHKGLLFGVEEYRLGIESGQTQQQLRGMMELQRWGQFWEVIGADVRRKMDSPKTAG